MLELTIYPALVALNAIPKIAIAPLLVIWMGFGGEPKIVMVVLICFFPIVVSTATGLKSTPAELVELVRSLSASPLQDFVKVPVPVGASVRLRRAQGGHLARRHRRRGRRVRGRDEGPRLRDRRLRAERDTPLAFAAIVLLALDEHRPVLRARRSSERLARALVGGDQR